MNVARIAGAGTVMLVLGAVAWLGVSHLVGSSPVTAVELVTSIEQNKQSLLEGLHQGQPLYSKLEKYKRSRLGPSNYPDKVIDETWLQPGENGSIETGVGTMRSLDGELLGYSSLERSVLVFTDVATGMTFDINVGHWDSLESWLNEVWNRPQTIQDPGVEFKGQGRLNQRESLIYEWSYTSQGGPDDGAQRSMLRRIELVEDAPLLYRESLYEIDDQGVRTLIEDTTVVEYGLLPEGSTVPTVADYSP